jgi:cytochrome c oxidase assembly factor CtaG
MSSRTPYTLAGVARRQWVYGLVALAVALCVGVGALGHTRTAGYLLAGVLLVVALLRLVVDPEKLGGLVLRSRAFDVIVVSLLGASIAVLAATTPNLA